MTWRDRSPCARVAQQAPGSSLHVAGWVDALRDHGQVRFIHLRDASGLVQVVFDAAVSAAAFEAASTLREEHVVQVRGALRRRDPGSENPAIETGDVEIVAEELLVLSAAAPLPFKVSEKALLAATPHLTEHVGEDLRLKYRFLDLRRPSKQAHLHTRHRIISSMRRCLDDAGFIEVETPMLTRSTPEGARDYLVPSRLDQGSFYALPQSPQLFKQMLMASGVERYYQVARCFRDEDLRPNRQPEFTQLDVEASFIDESYIMQTLESVARAAFAAAGHELGPCPRMTWDEAMQSYGSDKPDLRPGMPLFDVTEAMQGTGYGIFRGVVEAGGCIKGICVKGQSEALSKNELQSVWSKEVIREVGGKGMTWMKMEAGELRSNIAQFFSAAELAAVASASGAQDGDVVMMVADADRRQVQEVLGKLRLRVAARLGIGSDRGFMPLWVTEFPLFERVAGALRPMHHPFTSPSRTDVDLLDPEALLSLRARAYDLVVNGEELGGGSIRIHDATLQRALFTALGLSPEVQEERFGFFLRALSYGTPPHGGMALGIDRLVAMAIGVESIREVIAFPKNGSGHCPLTNAPAPVEPEQLQVLGIRHPRAGRLAV